LSNRDFFAELPGVSIPRFHFDSGLGAGVEAVAVVPLEPEESVPQEVTPGAVLVPGAVSREPEALAPRAVSAEAEKSAREARFERAVLADRSAATAVVEVLVPKAALGEASAADSVVAEERSAPKEAESRSADWAGREESASKDLIRPEELVSGVWFELGVVYSAGPLAATAVAEASPVVEECFVPVELAESRSAADWAAEKAFAPELSSAEAFVQALKAQLVFVPDVDNCSAARHQLEESRPVFAREFAPASVQALVPALVALYQSAGLRRAFAPAVALCRLAEAWSHCLDVPQAFVPVVAGFHCREDFAVAAFRAPHPGRGVVSLSLPWPAQWELRQDLCWSKSFSPARPHSPFRVRNF
jgi:hypothetical protein